MPDAANVVQAHFGGGNRARRADELPDPRPAAASAFREMVDRGGLSCQDIADAAMTTMGLSLSVDVVARWHDGLGFPPSYIWLLVRWLSAASHEIIPSLVP